MMYYYAKMSFKEGLSNEKQLKVIEQITNNKGTLTPDLFQYFDLKDVVQQPSRSIDVQGTPLNESLISKGVTSEQVAKVFCENMQPQDSDKEMVIIDPYFFSVSKKTIADICIRLSKILDKYPTISTIKIVTDDRHIKECHSTMIKILKQDNRKILYANSHDFHDRFWLIDGGRGVAVGTSLNGIGSGIFLIAPLEKDDVKDIMNEVNKLNFQSL